jgi:hypothetical protein
LASAPLRLHYVYCQEVICENPQLWATWWRF